MQVGRTFFLWFLMLLPFVKGYASGLKEEASIGFDTYSDNGDVQVYSPTVMLMKSLTKELFLNFRMRIDAISAASIRDGGATQPATVASASARGDEDEGPMFDDVRYAPSLAASYDDGVNAGSAGVYYTTEQDYDGFSFFGSYVRQFNEQNTALGIGFSQSSDTWSPNNGRQLPVDYRKERKIDFSVNQLLSPTAQVQFVYSNLYSDGFLASPYHYVEDGRYMLYENYPDRRTGHAFAVKGVMMLDRDDSLHGGYRYYYDDWGIASHTANVEWLRDFSASVTSGLRFRYYTQTAADFTKQVDGYSRSDPYVVVDYRMSAFDSFDIGIPFIYKPSPTGDVKWSASIDYYQTSDNAYIQNWYNVPKLQALYTTLTVEFGY